MTALCEWAPDPSCHPGHLGEIWTLLEFPLDCRGGYSSWDALTWQRSLRWSLLPLQADPTRSDPNPYPRSYIQALGPSENWYCLEISLSHTEFSVSLLLQDLSIVPLAESSRTTQKRPLFGSAASWKHPKSHEEASKSTRLHSTGEWESIAQRSSQSPEQR